MFFWVVATEQPKKCTVWNIADSHQFCCVTSYIQQLFVGYPVIMHPACSWYPPGNEHTTAFRSDDGQTPFPLHLSRITRGSFDSFDAKHLHAMVPYTCIYIYNIHIYIYIYVETRWKVEELQSTHLLGYLEGLAMGYPSTDTERPAAGLLRSLSTGT